MTNELEYMREALAEAHQAFHEDEIPIGAILVQNDKIIAKAHNTRETSKNPLHHAEILILEKAGPIIDDWRLTDTTLYVTVEPCPMCLGALLQARVGRLVFGCSDPQRKNITLQNSQTKFFFPSLITIEQVTGNSHTVQITGGVLENECAELLKNFFRNKRL